MKRMLLTLATLLLPAIVLADEPQITIECPNAQHPNTAIITAKVNPACPDKTGEATLTIDDYTTKPAGGGAPRTYRRLRSVSPCGCLTSGEGCDCLPIGIYKGSCANRLSTYEVKCSAAETPLPPPPKAVTGSLALSTSCDGTKCVLVKSDTAPSAIQQAKAKLAADIDLLESTAGSMAAAQTALTNAQTALAALQTSASSLQTQVAQDQAALNEALGILVPVNPINPVTPTPPTHQVAIVEVSTSGCPACNALDPIVKTTPGITRVNVDLDPTLMAKWQPAYFPTMVVTVDGKELVRYPKAATDKPLNWDKAMLVDWLTRCQAWAAKDEPNP